MFSKRFSPITGREEWFEMEEDYDSRRDIARSTYGDMLHDEERNKQYYKAIRKEVQSFISQGRMPYGIDIGTGTGLLAMMAAASGVNKITACEAFLPVAKVAKTIIQANGLANNITVVPKSSVETRISEDMPEKADLCVMELFDTELIGEGLLPSMRHAHQNLLKKNATVVPAAATVYVQLLQSEMLWRMHQLLPDITDTTESSLDIPAEMVNCKGAPSVFDVQADEIPLDSMTTLTEPVPVLRLLFCELDSKSEKKNSAVNQETVMDRCEANQVLRYLNEVSVKDTGIAHVILMWWVLQMDKEGEFLLSMAPKWMDENKVKRNEWRDHWMQGIYFLEKPLLVKKDESLSIQTTHDDYAFWFDVHRSNRSSPPCLTSRIPLCTCGVHTVWSRARFAMVNDLRRRKLFYTLSKKLVKNGVRVGLIISDGSLLSIIAAMAGFEKVYVLEPEVAARRIIQQLVSTNNLTEKVVLLPKRAEELTERDIQEPIDVILGEPFFLSSLLPWHDLYFLYASRTVLSCFNHFKDIKVCPRSACLKAIGGLNVFPNHHDDIFCRSIVELKNLWKIKAPVGTVEGFNAQAFDELIQSCSVKTEEIEAEPHSMWEYPCRALTNVVSLLYFDFLLAVPEEKQETNGNVEFTREGRCNGVVLWMDYMLDEETTISTGLQETLEVTSDGYVKNWVKFYKQGVYFLHTPSEVGPNRENTKLDYTVTFQPTTGSLTMKFEGVS